MGTVVLKSSRKRATEIEQAESLEEKTHWKPEMGLENETFTTVSYGGTQNYNQFRMLSQNSKECIQSK